MTENTAQPQTEPVFAATSIWIVCCQIRRSPPVSPTPRRKPMRWTGSTR
jgi:hypothetical protein